jgi:hypothetical protein
MGPGAPKAVRAGTSGSIPLAESNDPGRLTTRVDLMWLVGRSCDRLERVS